MKKSQIALFLRDTLAVIIVGLFLFPIFWWGLNSIKPASALFDKDGIVFFDFVPSFVNYWVTFSGDGPGVYDARQAIADTLIVALGSTILVIGVGIFAAYALSRLSFRMKRYYIAWTIFQRFTPPIAIIIPIVSIFHTFGLFDTHVGLILMHTVMNLPIAILMLKSFFDDVPAEIDDAAMIDGASRFTLLFRICLPMIKGGIAATAVLCFIFSWTEFLMALFITSTIYTLPVKLSIVGTMTSGFASALGTVAMVPTLIFIFLVQKHLMRGLTLGMQKG
jgi:multiple sugar transport system permease protein